MKQGVTQLHVLQTHHKAAQVACKLGDVERFVWICEKRLAPRRNVLIISKFSKQRDDLRCRFHLIRFEPLIHDLIHNARSFLSREHSVITVIASELLMLLQTSHTKRKELILSAESKHLIPQLNGLDVHSLHERCAPPQNRFLVRVGSHDVREKAWVLHLGPHIRSHRDSELLASIPGELNQRISLQIGECEC